jgi:RNA polymerase sigma-70 factor, ECF subfamily
VCLPTLDLSCFILREADLSRLKSIIVQDLKPLSDSDLVAHALRDTSVYAVLVRRWEPPLTRYVRRLLGANTQSAEDVLQETFLKAYVNLNDFDQTRPFGPWIYRIARNEAITLLRKKRIEPPLVTGDDADLILERMSDGITAQEIYDQKRMSEQIRAAIQSMDARYREALMLRYLDDKGYDEIADILEMPSGTVATLINRGTKQLRAALELAVSKGML